MASEWNPKEHYDNGNILLWGEDIPPGAMDSLRKGEVFTLVDRRGSPHSKVLMDTYDQLREKRLEGDGGASEGS